MRATKEIKLAMEIIKVLLPLFSSLLSAESSRCSLFLRLAAALPKAEIQLLYSPKWATDFVTSKAESRGVRGSDFTDWTSIHIRSMILRIIIFQSNPIHGLIKFNPNPIHASADRIRIWLNPYPIHTSADRMRIWLNPYPIHHFTHLFSN